MIDREFARRLVAEHIEEGCRNADGVTPVVLDGRTIEREFGWVFFYDSREFVENGEFSARMVGNAPIIVDRRDGSLHESGTALSVGDYIKEYEARRGGTSE